MEGKGFVRRCTKEIVKINTLHDTYHSRRHILATASRTADAHLRRSHVNRERCTRVGATVFVFYGINNNNNVCTCCSRTAPHTHTHAQCGDTVCGSIMSSEILLNAWSMNVIICRCEQLTISLAQARAHSCFATSCVHINFTTSSPFNPCTSQFTHIYSRRYKVA